MSPALPASARPAALPLLLCDVDGVLNPLSPRGGAAVASGRYHGRLPAEMVTHAASLSGAFEWWWATAWEDHANDVLSPLLGLPRCPVVRLTFGGRDSWKLRAVSATVDRLAADRPVAWVDDHIGERARRWAASRRAPTLVVPVEPSVGLTSVHVDELLSFAAAHPVPTSVPRHAAEPQVEGLGVRRAVFLAGRRLRPRAHRPPLMV